MTVGWSMPVSINPPMVALGIHPRRYSYALIRELKEFVVNIPTAQLKGANLLCGKTTGRGHVKFAETGLTPTLSMTVASPTIKECVASMECKLVNGIVTGDHTLFIGEVTAVYFTDGSYDRRYALGLLPLLYHLGGNEFVTCNRQVS